jgi:hypothetical protein
MAADRPLRERCSGALDETQYSGIIEAVFQALPTLKAMFPGNHVLDVILSWLSAPSLGVQRIPASDRKGIASADLMEHMLNLLFDVSEI